MLLCGFKVWFALQIFTSEFLPDTSFHKARSSCSWLSLDWVAYCIWVTHDRSGWCLSQFLEQCVCKNPACVTSASLLFSKQGGSSAERPWKLMEASSPIQAQPWECPLPASADQLQKICGHIHFFSIWTSLCYTVCFKPWIRIFRKTLGKFQVYYRVLNS